MRHDPIKRSCQSLACLSCADLLESRLASALENSSKCGSCFEKPAGMRTWGVTMQVKRTTQRRRTLSSRPFRARVSPSYRVSIWLRLFKGPVDEKARPSACHKVGIVPLDLGTALAHTFF